MIDLKTYGRGIPFDILNCLDLTRYKNSRGVKKLKNHAKLVGQTIDEQETKLTFKDTILYALSLGYGENPDQEEHLKYVYEEDLHTLPGISMVLAYPGFWMRSPEYGFDWRQVLHAEESFKIHQEIPAEANLYGKTTIEKVVDRGKNKGCFVYSRKELFLDDKKPYLPQ